MSEFLIVAFFLLCGAGFVLRSLFPPKTVAKGIARMAFNRWVRKRF